VPEQRPAATEAGVSADIRISGIAWQDERTARRAVVNGFLMKEGGVVAGARIVEILQDRVRFSQSGRDFELSLVVTGASGAVK
jgi:general secretion pathway protein B